MRSQNNGWRIEQIAMTILYRLFGNVSFTRSPKGICDFIVSYNDGTGLRFGVVVKETSFNESDNFHKLINTLEQTNLFLEENKMPIIALYVDEVSENAKVAFLVGWRFEKPRIYKDFELRNLNEKSAGTCLQIIKSMDNVIRLLSADELYVLKHLVFSRKHIEERSIKGEILYLRKLSTTYRMKQNEVVDEKQRLERLIKGVPEEEYPKDDLDRLIIEAVKAKFKDAKVKSSLMIFSTELDDLQYFKRVHCHHTSLVVWPKTSNLSVLETDRLIGLDPLSLDIELYVDNLLFRDAFDSVSFEKEESWEGWNVKLAEWNNMKETMRPISQFFR